MDDKKVVLSASPADGKSVVRLVSPWDDIKYLLVFWLIILC